MGTWPKLTSALHEGEEVVQELLAFGIIVDFVQLQGEKEAFCFSKSSLSQIVFSILITILINVVPNQLPMHILVGLYSVATVERRRKQGVRENDRLANTNDCPPPPHTTVCMHSQLVYLFIRLLIK